MRDRTGNRTRGRGIAVLGVFGLAAILGACSKPASREPARSTSEVSTEPSRSSEAAKTRELEAKAEDYKSRFEEIQASDMTAEQKAQAASELVDEQQRTVQGAESNSDSGGDDPN